MESFPYAFRWKKKFIEQILNYKFMNITFIKEPIKAITFTIKVLVVPVVIVFVLFCICGAIGMYHREHRPVSEIVDPNLHGVFLTENGNWFYE